MTTIAFNQFEIAADTQAINCGIIEQTPYQKIFVKDGRVYALAGLAALLPQLVRWYEDGADPAKVPTFKAKEENWFGEFIVYDSERFIHYCPLPDFPYGSEVPPPFALGTGAKFAMGAMLAGKTPFEAVEIASKLDNDTGGMIQTVDLRKFTKPRLLGSF